MSYRTRIGSCAPLLLAVMSVPACTGIMSSPSGPSGPGFQSSDPAGVSADPASEAVSSPLDLRDPAFAGEDSAGGGMPLRGLTRAEYNNTVAALLGDTSAIANTWSAETPGPNGFLAPRPVSNKEVSEYMDGAQDLADRFKAKLDDSVLGCSVSTAGEEVCAKSFITSFGRKAFRRPLVNEEVTDYVGLWKMARTTSELSFQDSMGLVVEAMLQSPSFLYHWELGPKAPSLDGDGDGKLVALSSYELAARLSYFLTQAPPDAKLAGAADSGAILDLAQLNAHADRLMESGKAKALFQDFIAQLLNVTDFSFSEDSTMRAMDQSRRAFVEQNVWSASGSPDDLFLSSEFFVNGQVAGIYGLTGVKGDELVKISMDQNQRFGLLTHADFLAKTGHGNDSLAPRRGRAVWQNLLCGAIPNGLPAVPPEIPRDPTQTMREHFEKKVAPLVCARACHATLDPAGFAFENYGGPVWRDTDPTSGKPINSAATLKLPFGDLLTYKGPRDFVEGLAGSEELKQCLTRQMFRLAIGRSEAKGDLSGIKAVYDKYTSEALDIKALAVAVVSAKAFTHRRLNEGEVAQ